MEDLSIYDLDGVIFNSGERDDTAYHNFLAVIRSHQLTTAKERPALKEIVNQATDTYWRSFFEPVNAADDPVIPGAREGLDSLAYMGWVSLYLSARPEALRKVTTMALAKYEIAVAYPIGVADPLILKPKPQSNVRTLDWKLSEIENKARLYRPKRLLLVDDRQDVLDAAKKLDLPCKVYTALSLAEATTQFAK